MSLKWRHQKVDLDLTHSEVATPARMEGESVLGDGSWLGRYISPGSSMLWLDQHAIGSRFSGGIYNSGSEGIISRRRCGGVVCR